jgi:hypothetical protein
VPQAAQNVSVAATLAAHLGQALGTVTGDNGNLPPIMPPRPADHKPPVTGTGSRPVIGVSLSGDGSRQRGQRSRAGTEVVP